MNRSPLWAKIERQARVKQECERLERQRISVEKLRRETEEHAERQREINRKRNEQLSAYRSAGRTIADEIISQVMAEFPGLSLAGVIGPRRVQHLITPRFKIAWRLYAETELSLTQIGKKIGRRDHSSAWHAIVRHKVLNGLDWPPHRLTNRWSPRASNPNKGGWRIHQGKGHLGKEYNALRNAAP